MFPKQHRKNKMRGVHSAELKYVKTKQKQIVFCVSVVSDTACVHLTMLQKS